MRGFELHEPTSIAEVVELLDRHGTRARPLGGGTDLVVGIMRDLVIGAGMPYPSHLLDVTTVPEMVGIGVAADGLTIGAATRLIDIVGSEDVRRAWPLLADATGDVASPEIRAVGTLGGNLHQRPRCWFFRNKDFDCAKKGGDICFAIKGDNRYHAILGGNQCFIVHPSDIATALVALDATARVASPAGERTVSFGDYFIGPNEDLLRETVLGPDDLLVDVHIPVPPTGTHHGWGKVNEKGAATYDFALASVALTMTVADGVWLDGRIVLGGVAPVPYRATVVEESLAGNDIRAALPDAIAEIDRIARPMGDNAYKVNLVKHLLGQVVLETMERGAIEASGGHRGTG
jgi:xanthine dehydrogenase YagS FAD-binding subunit